MNKFTAIYVRRSVSDADKGNSSLSIEAQKEECIRFLGGDANYKMYCDDGKSGKDIEHRPAFQLMMTDAREGLISKIVVKKYDRFSRNMREYLNITDELDKYGVGVVSLCEPFNTETKEGRMMRNNLLNFAEFERETIAARVKDAYDTKAMETGFYQGGKVYFGFDISRRTINGKTGSVLVPSEAAQTIITAYEMYKEPDVSLADVCKYIQENNLPTTSTEHGEKITLSVDTAYLSQLLKNPMYVRADKEVYRYLMSKGFNMIDDIDMYDGVHGVFRHKPRLPDRYVKMAYHEGLVSSETWLAVQDKKDRHRPMPLAYSRTNIKSWLSGLMKCAHCGRAIHIDYTFSKKTGKEWRYLDCTGFASVKGCIKRRIQMRIEDIEDMVYKAMVEHISEFKITKAKSSKGSAEAEKIKAEILRIETETRKLIDKLPDADNVLFEYIQGRITELHTAKQEYENKLLNVERKVKHIDTKPLIDPLNRWDELTKNEQNAVARIMIDKVLISDETGIDIHFSF